MEMMTPNDQYDQAHGQQKLVVIGWSQHGMIPRAGWLGIPDFSIEKSSSAVEVKSITWEYPHSWMVYNGKSIFINGWFGGTPISGTSSSRIFSLFLDVPWITQTARREGRKGHTHKRTYLRCIHTDKSNQNPSMFKRIKVTPPFIFHIHLPWCISMELPLYHTVLYHDMSHICPPFSTSRGSAGAVRLKWRKWTSRCRPVQCATRQQSFDMGFVWE